MKKYKQGDFTDCAETHLAGAAALSAILYGAGGDAFHDFNPAIRDDVLWLLSREIHQAQAAYYAEHGSDSERQQPAE